MATPRNTLTLATAALEHGSAELLAEAATLATTSAERQAVAIAAAYLGGDHDLLAVLVPDHLADHPDDALVRRIAAAAPSTTPSAPPVHPKESR
jgi:hypothetical protein